MNQTIIADFESKLERIHGQAVEARDAAQNVIAEVRRIKEWLTQVQIEISKAELKERER